MRRPFAVIALVGALYFAVPAQAQFRADLPTEDAPVAVAQQQPGLSLGALFNPETMRIGHAYEMSYSSFGGESLGLGVYTTSLQWQPSAKLAARVDVGVAHSPFGTDALQQRLGFTREQPARPFLRNAEIAYRPTENATFHLQVRQSPFGGYASPYGTYYNPYYGGSHFRAAVGTADSDALFWRTAGR